MKLRDIGFKSVAWQDLTFGIVAVHIGYKGEVAKDASAKP
jgi:demethylmenaquinone methyltransferase/2-methoxy-6-polyprenyl-1,4-benzoquinol methylase